MFDFRVLKGIYRGAFTGGVSVGMLKSVGVKYVLVGHSERRQGMRQYMLISFDTCGSIIDFVHR